jgi:hypothetical protein
MSKPAGTRDLYREQEFFFIDEVSGWIERDYYNDDLEGLVSVFATLKEWVEEKLETAKEYGVTPNVY